MEQVGNFIHTGNFSNPQRGRVYDANALSPSLNTCGGGGQEVKIVEPVVQTVGNLYEHSQANEVISPDGLSKTLCAGDGPKSAQVKIIVAQRGRGEPQEPDSKINIVGSFSDTYKSAQVIDPCGVSPTLRARDYKDPIRIVEGQTDECI